MAGSDIRQLILQVDASVAVAQRNLRSLSASVDSDTKSIEGSLARVDNAHQKMSESFGNTRVALMEVQHVAKASADQFAAGTPVLQIFTQHLAQLSQAASFAGGEGALGKFSAFLAGPWGIAVTLAAVVIGKLAAGHDAAGQSVEELVAKMRQQAEQAARNRQADDEWKASVEGLTEAIRKQREEQAKALQTDLQTQQAALDGAVTNQARLNEKVAQTRRDLQQAQADLDAARSVGGGANGGTGLNVATTGAAQRVQQLKAQLDSLVRAENDAAVAVRQAQTPIAERSVADKLDKASAATTAYTKTLGDLRIAYDNGAISLAKFNAELTKAQVKRDAALEAARASKKAPAQQFGREINLQQAEGIVQGIGGTVTSSYRTRAEQQHLYDTLRTPQNPVALPGTSAHEHGNALDVAFGTGITVDSLKKAFADEGVRLTKVLKETGHYHIEFATPGADKQARASDKAARQAAAEAKRQTHDNSAFLQESDRDDQELLAAQRALISGVEDRARFAEEQVRAEQKRADDAINGQLAEGKLTKAQADLLHGKEAAIASQKISNIEIQKQEQLARDANDLAAAQSQTEIEHLQHLNDLAVTSAQHRDIQLKIVDAQTQILINAQQEIIDSKLSSQAQKDLAQAMIDRAKLAQQDAHESINRQNQTPGQNYLQSLKDADARMGEEFQTIQSKGLDSLNSGLVDAIMGTKKLGDVFHDVAKQIVADLLQIAIRKAVIEPLANSLFGGGSGGSGGFGSILSGLGSIFGGGGWHSGTFNMGTTAATALPHLATGGSFVIGGTGGVDKNMLSLNGQPTAMVGRGETVAVIPKAANINVPQGGVTTNVNQHFTIQVDASNAVLVDQVQRMVAQGVGIAAQAGAQGGRGLMRQDARRQIP